MEKTKTFKKAIGLMLCAVFFAAGMWLVTEEASAISYTGKGKLSWYQNVPDYSHGYKVIGEAYVVGSDNKVKTNSFGRGVHVNAYSATGSGYGDIVKGNIQNLYNLYRDSGATGSLNAGWPTNIEYYLCEGEKLQVLSYDDTYVYYYSPGFKSFGSSIYNCDQTVLLESHPAGVYKVKTSEVWLDIQGRREKATSTSYVGTGQALVSTVGVYQDLDMIGKKAKCYAYPVNTEIKIVNATPVTASDGKKYYKAVVKGDNAVGYFTCNNFYVYVNKEEINYHANNKSIPSGYSIAKIEGVASGYLSKIYPDKSTTEGIGIIANDAKIKTYPSKSDSTRTCIWYNDGYAYVPTKFIKFHVDELKIQDIVKDKYVLSWSPVPVEVVLTAKENWSGEQIKIDGKNTSITLPANTKTYTVNNAILYEYDGRLPRQGIEVTVQVKGDDVKGSHKLYCPENTSSLFCRQPQNTKLTINSSWMGKQYGTVLEYSTNKNFKNAKKVYPKGNYHDVKKLKKNTKYYFRAYNTFNVKTENGSKLKKGKTSKTYAVKTTNISVAKPTMKAPSKGKKSLTVKWKKYNGKASYYEVVVATNKAFTKNVQKGKPTKSLTSIKFSNLKAKKKYYVKMRAVYRYYGAEYKSGWTKVKTVRTR